MAVSMPGPFESTPQSPGIGRTIPAYLVLLNRVCQETLPLTGVGHTITQPSAFSGTFFFYGGGKGGSSRATSFLSLGLAGECG